MEKFEKREKIDRKKKEQESAEGISGLKKCWGRFRVGFSCQTFFLFSESLALTSQKNSVT